jgi:hypothetical protein
MAAESWWANVRVDSAGGVAAELRATEAFDDDDRGESRGDRHVVTESTPIDLPTGVVEAIRDAAASALPGLEKRLHRSVARTLEVVESGQHAALRIPPVERA